MCAVDAVRPPQRHGTRKEMNREPRKIDCLNRVALILCHDKRVVLNIMRRWKVKELD